MTSIRPLIAFAGSYTCRLFHQCHRHDLATPHLAVMKYLHPAAIILNDSPISMYSSPSYFLLLYANPLIQESPVEG